MLNNFNRHVRIFILISLTLIRVNVYCQTPSGLSIPTNVNSHITPGGLLDTIADGYGNRYSLAEIAINDTIRAAARGFMSPSKPSSCTSGYFKMWLEKDCGLDGAGSDDIARLNVLCHVLKDISDFIPSALPSGQYVNIWVKSQITGSYGIGSPFFNVPRSSTVSGITDNAIWITINSGQDAFVNTATPISTSGGGSIGTTFFHGSIAFNFDPSILYNTDLTRAPTGGEVDLYTVALHEMMHAMGFASIMDKNGHSVIGTDYPYYTRYDRNLQTYTGSNHLLTTTSSCDLYGQVFNSGLSTSVLSPGTCPSTPDHTNCAQCIEYAGSWPVNIPVYTPGCFAQGSSLSHFEDECYVPSDTVLAHSGLVFNNQYYLMSNAGVPGPYIYITNPGAMKRYLKPEERQVLCDIGYQVNTKFGHVSDLNYIDYGGSACGQSVAGINDGILSDHSYAYVSFGPTIDINPSSARILSNDHGATGYKNVELVIGDGVPLNTSGTNTTPLFFQPGPTAHGVQLLRYIPYDITTGVEGNITYIYVYVGFGCNPTICDLVSNGDFESSVLKSTNPDYLYCWSSYSGTPDVFYRGALGWPIPNPYSCCTTTDKDVHPGSGPGTSIPNDQYLGLFSGPLAPSNYYVESVNQSLASSLVNGTTYTISFWAKISDAWDLLPIHLQFATSPITPLSAIPYFISALPSGLTQLCDITITHPDYHWQHFTKTVTCTSNANSLVVLNSPYLNSPGYPTIYYSYLLIDDISIKPVNISGSFSPPSSICSSSGIFDLDLYNPFVGMSGGTYSWETEPVGGFPSFTPTISNNHLFNPVDAYNASIDQGGSGKVIVSYTYTDVSGCVQTLYANIVINTPPITGYPEVCVGAAMPLYNDYIGGTWTSSDISKATVNSSTGVVTGVAMGTSTITYATPCGYSTLTMTVNPLPVISGNSIVCEHMTLALTANIGGGTWSSSDNTVATIDASTGIVTATTAGTTIITYTTTSSCISTKIITVVLNPTAITGTTPVCAGVATLLNDGVAGGTWSSGTPGIASITLTTGIYTGITNGSTIITYTMAPGCIVTKTVSISPTPGPITGTTFNVCGTGSITLGNPVPGGTWTSSDMLVATVTSGGIVTGVAPGTAMITYTMPGGCFVTAMITENPNPAPITGAGPMCVGTTLTLADATPGGVWTSSDPTAATIGLTSGIVTALTVATTLITYTSPAGCIATVTETIYRVPTPISGSSLICIGTPVTFTDFWLGGTWASSAPAVATATYATGIITGITPGTSIITYTLPGGCMAYLPITVNPSPRPITGHNTLCMGLPITLSNAVSGGTWTSSNPAIATVAAGTGVVTGVTNGMVTITYTIPGGCYATYTVHVANDGGSCTPCHLFTGGYSEIPGGTLSTDLTADFYYISGVITINGNVSFSDAVIQMGSGTRINVSPSSSLSISGSHLFACGTTWYGISLQSDLTQTGTVSLQGGTARPSNLIENAGYAIDIENPVAPTGGAANFVNCTNTTFNNNFTGIYISNYTATTPAVYPFHVENTIFTSRNFNSYPGGPYISWPGVATLKGIVTPPTKYDAPYHLCTFPIYSMWGTPNGIELHEVGNGTSAYAGIVVGEPYKGETDIYSNPVNTELNIFDELNYGIYAKNSNLTSHNSSFTYIGPPIRYVDHPMPDKGFTGIYTKMTDSKPYQLVIEPTRYGTGTVYTSNNSFYNCWYSVYSSNYNQVIGKNSYMVTSNTDGSLESCTITGYTVESVSHDLVDISNNTIVSVPTGILYRADAGGWPYTFCCGGQVTITNNTISGWYDPPGPVFDYYFVNHAIWLENTIGYMLTVSLTGAPQPQANVDNNTLTNVYNGITINGFRQKAATSNNNTIQIYDYFAGDGHLYNDPYGIYHMSCNYGQILHNDITGGAAYGVREENSVFSTTQCNNVTNTGIGFHFEGTFLSKQWLYNTMTNTDFGLSLNGIIGPQGTYYTPSDNKWIATGGFSWGMSPGHFQIMSGTGILPTASTLTVRGGVTTDPSLNYGYSGLCAETFGCAGGIYTGSGNGLYITPAATTYAGCNYDPGISPVNPDPVISIVTTDLGHPLHVDTRLKWMDQYALWNMMQLDTTLCDTIAAVNSFRTMAANSRYAVLTSIENKLALGDIAGAQTVLTNYTIDSMANMSVDTITGAHLWDDTAADAIVINYRTFYTIYIAYRNGTMTGTDTTAVEQMAKLCPMTDGDVVYKARALYNALHHSTRLFPDVCDSVMNSLIGTDTTGGEARHSNTTASQPSLKLRPVLQKYTLQPNPNDGNFMLQQAVVDEQPVSAELWDAVGRCVYKQPVQFTGKQTELHIRNAVPGLYLLRLTDKEGKSYNLKCVVK